MAWLLRLDPVGLKAFGWRGAVAQMGERCNRTAEVRGSIPLSSTSPFEGVAVFFEPGAEVIRKRYGKGREQNGRRARPGSRLLRRRSRRRRLRLDQLDRRAEL